MTERAAPAAIVLLAIVLRLAAMIYLHAINAPAEENRLIAANLAAGRGFTLSSLVHAGPTTVRPPLYPFFLAGLDRALGVDSRAALAAALAANVAAAALSVAAAMAIVGRAAGARAARAAGVLLAIWPTQIYAAAQFQGLALAVLLMLTMLWLTQNRSPLAGGVAAGLAVVTESILLLPLLAVGLWSFRRSAEGLILLPLAMLALALPWAYRNTLVRERITPLTGNFSGDLFRGNGPDANGSQQLTGVGIDGKPASEFDRLSTPQSDALRFQPEAQRDQFILGWAMDWISKHPIAYARLCIVRAMKTVWLDWSHPLAGRFVNVAARSLAAAMALAALLRRQSWSAEQRHLCSCANILMIGLIAAAMFTMAEARSAVLMDVPQLLLGATLFKRGAA